MSGYRHEDQRVLASTWTSVRSPAGVDGAVAGVDGAIAGVDGAVAGVDGAIAGVDCAGVCGSGVLR